MTEGTPQAVIAEAPAPVQQGEPLKVHPNAQKAVEGQIEQAKPPAQPVLTDEQKREIAAEAEQAKQATTQTTFDVEPFIQQMAKEAGEAGRYFVSIESLMAKLIQEPPVAAVLKQKGVDVDMVTKKLEVSHALANNYTGKDVKIETDHQIPIHEVNMPGYFKDAVLELTIKEIEANNPAPTKIPAAKLLEETLAKIKSSPRYAQNLPHHAPKDMLKEVGLSLEVLNPERAAAIEAEHKKNEQPLRTHAAQIMR